MQSKNVSLCVIVKNSADTLDIFFNWATAHFEEICMVVDFDNYDKTIEVVDKWVNKMSYYNNEHRPKVIFRKFDNFSKQWERSFAKKNIPIDYFKQQMKESGIACMANESTLDEAPDAYKNPDAVMESQTELVDIVNRLYPIVCVKSGRADDGD